MADLPLALPLDLAERLAIAFDAEGKLPRALEALGPLSARDVVLLDAGVGRQARRVADLGARLTLLERPAALAELQSGVAGLDPRPRVAAGTAGATGLPPESADVVVSAWTSVPAGDVAAVAEADRVLRPGGRLLVLHDYGRDDVSALRPADLPQYGSWTRRDGWFLQSGFKLRVIHCWWTFADLDALTAFLDDVFGAPGRTFAAGLRRPRLSYNLAIYHRSRGDGPAQA